MKVVLNLIREFDRYINACDLTTSYTQLYIYSDTSNIKL